MRLETIFSLFLILVFLALVNSLVVKPSQREYDPYEFENELDLNEVNDLKHVFEDKPYREPVYTRPIEKFSKEPDAVQLPGTENSNKASIETEKIDDGSEKLAVDSIAVSFEPQNNKTESDTRAETTNFTLNDEPKRMTASNETSSSTRSSCPQFS